MPFLNVVYIARQGKMHWCLGLSWNFPAIKNSMRVFFLGSKKHDAWIKECTIWVVGGNKGTNLGPPWSFLRMGFPRDWSWAKINERIQMKHVGSSLSPSPARGLLMNIHPMSCCTARPPAGLATSLFETPSQIQPDLLLALSCLNFNCICGTLHPKCKSYSTSFLRLGFPRDCI